MVKNMYQEIFGTLNVIPKLYCDNKAAIAISLSQGNKRNIRHIELRYQLMKQTFEAKTSQKSSLDYRLSARVKFMV
jgi:hypothetical protein